MTSHAAYTAINVGRHEAELTKSCDALVDGSIGMSHLDWSASTANRLEDSRTKIEPFDEGKLLPAAKKLNVLQFRRRCQEFIHKADHAAFVRDEFAEANWSRLRISTCDDGFVTIDGTLHPEAGAIVNSALAPFIARRNKDDHLGLPERTADGLIEMCGMFLDSGKLPMAGGQRPDVHVTTSMETLLDYAGAAPGEFESGVLLSGTGCSASPAMRP